MKHTLRLGLPLVLPLLAALLLIAGESPRARLWEQEVIAYVAWVEEESDTSIRVRHIARASQPWRLSDQVSTRTYSSGIHFHTDHGLSTGAGGNILPPYPPTNAYCVFLESSSGREFAPVFVALHQSLYLAQWIVHEPAGDATDAAALASAMGCNK